MPKTNLIFYSYTIKVKGTSASEHWDDLSEDIKKIVVSQIARHLLEIFSLRFESAGSLYLSPLSPDFVVGPIVSTPFYRALDGVVRVPDTPISQTVDPNRGPFSTVSEYLSSNLRVELELISNHRSIVLSELQGSDDDPKLAESRLELGERVMKKAVELCSVYYPGDTSVPANITTPQKPFSLKFDDFRLSNVMVRLYIPLIVSLIKAHVCHRSMRIQVE